MTKEQFLNDLQKIYDFLNDQKTKTNELIKFLENEELRNLKTWIYLLLLSGNSIL